jgi:hypothetical protein
MGSKIVDNRKVVDGILSQAQFNTHTWYERNSDGTFNINGSWYGSENIFNWVLTKSVNTKYIKSGVMKITTAKKSAVIKFETTFPDENYFIFFNSTANSNVYWTNKYINRAVINSSFTLGDEVTWFAIHKTLLISSSFNNSGNIFAGTRAIAGTLPDAYDVNGELIDTITISDSINGITGVAGSIYVLTDATGLMLVNIEIGSGLVWTDPIVTYNGTKLVYRGFWDNGEQTDK